MKHSPLDQFKIKPIINMELFGYDVSMTNSSLFMIFSLLFSVVFFCMAFRSKKLVPTKMQMAGELLYTTITSMIDQNIGSKGKKFTPFVFSIFIFILFCNLFGMLPYSFTVTSHIAVTFALAMVVFLIVTVVGFYIHGMHFLSLFLPAGTPLWLAPLMVIIEFFAYLAKPVSLSLRLAANMVAGHVLLKVMAGFVISLAIYLKFLPLPLIVILIGFEIFVALLQAYIFAILSCVYLNDAINLH